MKKENIVTNLLAIFACLLWSSAFTGVKIGLEYSTPLRFAGIRFFISGILLIPLAIRQTGYLQVIRKNIWKLVYIALTQIIVHYILFYYGLKYVPGAIGAIVIGAGPLFIALLAHFTIADDRMDWKKILVVLLGFSGIILVSVGRNQTSDNEVKLIGVILLIGVNLSSGLANVFIKKRSGNLPPLVMSSFTMWFGGLVIFLLSLAFEPGKFEIKPVPYYVALIWLSLLSAAAFSIWFFLLSKPHVKVSDLNFWKFLIPVSGALLAWLILPDESPSFIAVAGASLTGISLVLLNLVRRNIL